MRYEYQEVVATEGEAFWAECNRLGAEGWRLMDREDFERVTVATGRPGPLSA